MASEQATEAAVATAKESTTPTGGNDAILHESGAFCRDRIRAY